MAEGAAALACPAGTSCTDPAVLQPTVCDLGGTCTARGGCPLMPYCPAGSTREALCAAGAYCPNSSVALPCQPGTYCPAGSELWQLCPGGSFCASPATLEECPPRHFCPVATVQPVECSWLSYCYCDGGCSIPPYSALVLGFGFYAAVLVGAPVGAGALVWWLWARRRRRQQRPQPQWMGGPAKTTAASTTTPACVEMGHTSPLAASRAAASESFRVPLLATVGALDSGDSDGGDDPLSDNLLLSETRTGPPAGSPPLSRKAYTMAIRFERLGMTLRVQGGGGGGKRVLQDVTGELRPGRICAVMGPSGAGKTTCLTALSGRVGAQGVVSGSVFVNGAPGALTEAHYRHLVAFCPQEDVMLRDLTVRENIVFSALTRLPSGWPPARKLAFAEAVIDLLDLRAVADERIGDEAVRGISGGQRKRVNIGIEMAADPVVLFLDEPTSGLDSAGSLSVVTALRSIADLGLTIALVLHQPRYEIFAQFDDLLLLGRGGRTVYAGSVEGVGAYFERTFGLVAPPRANPADCLLDWLAAGGGAATDTDAVATSGSGGGGGGVSSVAGSGGELIRDRAAGQPPPPSPSAPVDFAGAWAAEEARTHTARVSPAEGDAAPPPPPPHDPPTFAALTLLVMRRSLTQQLRHPLQIALNNALPLVSALFLAAMYVGEPAFGAPRPIQAFAGCPAGVDVACQTCLSQSQDTILNRGIMACIAVGLASVSSFVPVFGGGERVVFRREAASLPQPRHTLAYFIGKDLAHFPQVLLGPFVFTVAYILLATPRASFWRYFAVFAGTYWCSSSVGFLVGVVTPPAAAQLVGVTAVFALSLFAGAQPTLAAMRTKFIPLRYAPGASYLRYALEAVYVGEVLQFADVMALQGLDLAATVRDTLGFDVTAFLRDALVLVVYGYVVRAAACGALLWVVMGRGR